MLVLPFKFFVDIIKFESVAQLFIYQQHINKKQ